MHYVRTFVGAAALVAWMIGCQATFGEEPAGTGARDSEGPSGVGDAPACPVDPDCSIGGDCSLYECPDYWICEDLATAAGPVKRCTNPGPDYPDDSHDWTCEDVGGRTVCRGSDFPDGGGGGDWNCEREGEFVVCESDTPDYPDEGGAGPWNCRFEDEFRVCESGGGGGEGDGGGWTCYDTATGRECRRDDPDYPDDRDWACYDTEGETVCSGAGDVPDGGGGGDWDCQSIGEFVICRDGSPDYPDGGGGGDWDCYFMDELRVCTDGGGDTPGDGGGGGGGDTPGDGGCGGECIPGVERWCDTPIACAWGKQQCAPDGRWGACREVTERPAGCGGFFYDRDCCVDAGGCCQNFPIDDTSVGMCTGVVPEC